MQPRTVLCMAEYGRILSGEVPGCGESKDNRDGKDIAAIRLQHKLSNHYKCQWAK